MNLKYKRILLKLSGEALAGEQKYGICPETTAKIAKEVKNIHELGIEVALVIGGGNIFRGIAGVADGIDRSTGDYAGMLATIINAITFQSALEKIEVPTRVQTSISMRQIAEPYIRRKAIRHLEKKRVVIFAGGTGNPYFTTDTGAALRAAEINADAIFKATKVDGIYTADPVKDSSATKYEEISYLDVLKQELKVIDSAAISLCMDNNIPLVVFNLTKEGNALKAAKGEKVGTKVFNN